VTEDANAAELRAAQTVFDEAWDLDAVDDDAAADLYAEAARRLEHRTDDDARVLLIHALNNVIHIHRRHGRYDETRPIAERLVSEHFEDAPPDAAEVLADSALQLAWHLSNEGEYERAIDLQERVLERHGGPEAAYQLGSSLRHAGRLEEALRRFEALVRDLEDASDPDLRAIARAQVEEAAVLHAMDRVSDAIAVCEEITSRFGDSDDPEVVQQVAWAWHAIGRTLSDRVGRAAGAERAYRRAIEAGHRDSWFHLGVLLSGVRGRGADEERALRQALELEDRELAAAAALKLGNILQWLRGDLQGARVFYEMAVEEGAGVTVAHANVNLGHLAAYQGDRRAASEALRAGAVGIGEEHGCDVGDSTRPFTVIAAVASGRATRGLMRSLSRARYSGSRLVRALMRSSPVAVWLGRLR
jgi:tetratricopeptide (TPR) repeat protein